MRGLTDYPPARLGPTQRKLWESLYQQSVAAYGDKWGAHVADKVIQDLYTKAGARRRPPKLGTMPDAGNMISLGFLLELHFVSRGVIMVRKFKATDCLWSEKLRAVIAFPRTKLPPATVSPHNVPALLRLYRKWHDGKEPKNGASAIRYAAPEWKRVFPAVVIVYQSDKFDEDGEWVDYIHHDDTGAGDSPGPMVYQAPNAWMLRGGRLRLTSGGLIH